MKYVRFIAVITISLVSVLPSLLLAAETDYIPLVGIPGLNDPGNMTTENYINALYVIAISVAAFLAVVKLIFAGVKYIATDIVPGKEQAKKDIQNAIIGLLIVIGAVLILETINPQLTNLDALSKLEMIDVTVQDVVVIKPIEEASEICESESSCIRETCLVWGCETWCVEEKNGVYFPEGVCAYPPDDDTVTRLGEEEIEDPDYDFSCTVLSLTASTVDCAEAILECTQHPEYLRHKTIGSEVVCFKSKEISEYDISEYTQCATTCEAEEAACTETGRRPYTFFDRDGVVASGKLVVRCTESIPWF